MNFVKDIATDKMLRICCMAVLCSTYIIILIHICFAAHQNCASLSNFGPCRVDFVTDHKIFLIRNLPLNMESGDY